MLRSGSSSQVSPETLRPPGPRGQALIFIVFTILALVGITALAVDGGNAYADRRHAQNAADTAALQAALGRINGGAWLPRAYQVAASNGYTNDGVRNTVTISSPPTSGTYQGNLEYIQVRITSRVRTYFGSVVGMEAITNAVEAVSRSKPSLLGPLFEGAAAVSLASTSDCAANKAFYVHGEATLDVSGSGILVNSTNPTCALITQGEGSIRLEDGGPIRIVGGAQVQKPKLVTPYSPLTGWQAMSYPPPVFMPKIGCSIEARVSKTDPHTMSPGNWGGDFPPKDVDHLNSGVYCLDGDFVMMGNRTLTGNGVVIYMKKGQLRWTGASVLDLSAPHSGDFAGLLVYQPLGNKNPMILNAAEESKVQGTILAPGAPVRIKGNDSDYGFHGQIIGYTIEADGNSNVVIHYSAEQNYKALTIPEVQLVK
jgi:Flp pilus assembly protein TadG